MSEDKEVKTDQGIRHDQGKLRMDLVPPEFIKAVATILTFGIEVEGYSPENWRKGLAFSRVTGSLKRHLNSHDLGELIDETSGYPHLWHAACNIAFLIGYEFEYDKYKDFNDLYHHRGRK